MTMEQFKRKYSEVYPLNYEFFMEPFIDKYNSIWGGEKQMRQKRELLYILWYKGIKEGILKFVNGRNRSSAALKKAVEYVLNPEKSVENGFFCNGVRSDYPADDMELLQNILGKDKGRRYIHYVISFDGNVDERTAFDVSKTIADFFEEEFQFIGNVHANTDNVHVHIIMNSVSFKGLSQND